MSIRVAKEDDAPYLYELVKLLSHFYLENRDSELPSWLAQTLTQDSFLHRIQSDDYQHFVYEIQNETIGYLAMKGNSHLYHLFVSESHQGKGIARQLWNYAMTVCISDMYTLRSSLFAVPIYKKFGFKVSDKTGKKDGVGFQPMRLRL